MYELIITEKPNASKKIADALAEGKAIKESVQGVPYYKVTHKGTDIVVACAVGHLYGLDQKPGHKKWEFPVFDIEWQPSYKVQKGSAFTKKYLAVLQKLAKEASAFTVATDYDVEGEVIGLNVVKYAFRQKDAARMKFSTLTKDDLVEAYERKATTLDWGQANAGTTRHMLDWFYGINLSRALSSAIKAAGTFKVMSSGRVQGPALKILVDREREIKAFTPEPFWQIELVGKVRSGGLSAWHEKDKFADKKEADAVMAKTKGKDAAVSDIRSNQFQQAPPHPFDLTTLQTESYKVHRISPKNTLVLAQELYTSGYISYPRTSSQKLPPQIGYQKILSLLARQPEYRELVVALQKKGGLAPNEGEKTDPAHPAIYPTGLVPRVTGGGKKVYDLIVKRFLATFGEPAVRQTDEVHILCGGETFIAKGTRTVERGWHVLYEPYVTFKEEELSKADKGEPVAVERIVCHDKETQPPKRYTPASIIRELEKRNLGTKATRAQIVETLLDRGYVTGKSLEATEIGERTVDTLAKFSPDILDEELTRHFEEEMERIREGSAKPEAILDEAKRVLSKILDSFKGKEKSIGKDLAEANRETREAESLIGPCPTCKKGTLRVMYSKKFKRKFIACDAYPACKTTFNIPVGGTVKPTGKVCDLCQSPKVSIMRRTRKGMRTQEVCINPDCRGKAIEDADVRKEAEEIKNGEIEKECPKCKTGRLVVRRSVYGQFYGCSTYPKCRYTERLSDGPLKEDFGSKGKAPRAKRTAAK
ncbi:DNA topoisomerase I [Candidatus Woesearchaeota archaeon]|nr:DNA topoisomerase I [Candidatus Woesearchaeota archaeon]